MQVARPKLFKRQLCWVVDVAQLVEGLPSVFKALGLNPSSTFNGG